MGLVKKVWCRYSLILLLENILSKTFLKLSGRFFSNVKFSLSRSIFLKTALMSLDLSNCLKILRHHELLHVGASWKKKRAPNLF